jgi:hypothetical protein
MARPYAAYKPSFTRTLSGEKSHALRDGKTSGVGVMNVCVNTEFYIYPNFAICDKEGYSNILNLCYF